MWVCLNIGMEIAMCAMVKHSICMYNPPCNLGGGAGPLDSVEGPNVRYPVATLLNQSLLSRVGIYLLQNQEPSTALISDKKKHVFYKIKDLTCEGIKTNKKNITC